MTEIKPDDIKHNKDLLASGEFPYKKIIVCDIDGTVADLTHRLHLIRNEEGTKDWKKFFELCFLDKPRKDIIQEVKCDAQGNEAALIFVSGRSDVARKDTEEWVKKAFGYLHTPIILMRREKDKRPDTIVKKNIYNKYLKHYNIHRVYDDRPSVIRMWQEEGLEVKDCGNGKEF